MPLANVLCSYVSMAMHHMCAWHPYPSVCSEPEYGYAVMGVGVYITGSAGLLSYQCFSNYISCMAPYQGFLLSPRGACAAPCVMSLKSSKLLGPSRLFSLLNVQKSYTLQLECILFTAAIVFTTTKALWAICVYKHPVLTRAGVQLIVLTWLWRKVSGTPVSTHQRWTPR